eukprot:CAMPEP_0118798328 /NCGR_PEP_ID=MMETSP1161-20130426/729_1 /TAXON_ID=249345 /ORGANISM="Picochlorum oklahomensis, Strain CCMP2329" /LENGTH=370 /DNA_ID=CAMNT_0006725715 /DNA_START=72 /DNA_END=1181 /DNA_ORIENTATION=-
MFLDKPFHIVGLFLLLVVLALIHPIAGASAGSDNKKVLVLVDDHATTKTHSTFLDTIKRKGYDVTVSLATSDEVQLQDVETWLFDKLVVLGGQSKYGPGITARKQLEFFEAGHDLYVAVTPSAGSSTRALLGRLGADIEDSGSTVVDHFKYNAKIDEGGHTAVLTSIDDSLSGTFAPSTEQHDITCPGSIGFSISPEAYMTMGVLHGSPTAYSAQKDSTAAGTGKTALGGYNLKLAALVQGRNNARAAVLGSLDMLSNSLITSSKGNAGFAIDSLSWVFQERHVLHASAIRHRLVDGPWNPPLYRIKDDVQVFVDIEECNSSRCQPFDGKDVQVEFVMLDPYIRKTLTHLGNGTFTAQVKVPDVYGVFKW